jgi:hypothetical protein
MSYSKKLIKLLEAIVPYDSSGGKRKQGGLVPYNQYGAKQRSNAMVPYRSDFNFKLPPNAGNPMNISRMGVLGDPSQSAEQSFKNSQAANLNRDPYTNDPRTITIDGKVVPPSQSKMIPASAPANKPTLSSAGTPPPLPPGRSAGGPTPPAGGPTPPAGGPTPPAGGPTTSNSRRQGRGIAGGIADWFRHMGRTMVMGARAGHTMNQALGFDKYNRALGNLFTNVNSGRAFQDQGVGLNSTGGPNERGARFGRFMRGLSGHQPGLTFNPGYVGMGSSKNWATMHRGSDGSAPASPNSPAPSPTTSPAPTPTPVSPKVSQNTKPTPKQKTKLTPEQINQLRNSREAILKRASREKNNQFYDATPEGVAAASTTPGGRAAARDNLAKEQGGRFGRGGSIARANAQEKQNYKDSMGRRNPLIAKTKFRNNAKNIIKGGAGRVNVGSNGKLIPQKLVAHNENYFVGSLILEAISKYMKFNYRK